MEPVRISDCRCEGTPHDGQDGRDDGDIGYLRPFLDYAGGSEVLRAMRTAGGDTELFDELVGPVYINRGLAGWNRLDAEGGPLPLPDNPASALPFEEAYHLAGKADELYGKAILSPLAARIKQISTSSSGGPMAASTSANRPSGRQRRKRSA